MHEPFPSRMQMDVTTGLNKAPRQYWCTEAPGPRVTDFHSPALSKLHLRDCASFRRCIFMVVPFAI